MYKEKKFSLLMSIYYKEEAQYFDRCMQSIWEEQIVKPNEIILVEDGKLTDELYECIAKWKSRLGIYLSIVSLENNVGLGKALNIGLEECRYDIVARMDTDDISTFDRFEKQLQFLEEHKDIDLVGSDISEFDDNENSIVSYRKLPSSSQEMLKFAKSRNPINHPSVMYRKRAVMDVGSYKDMMGFEDYYLWIRMFRNGSKMKNIPEILVNMRAGQSQVKRRGGFTYLKQEFKFQKRLLDIGFIGYIQFFKNMLIRMSVRLVPNKLRGFIYSLIRKV